MAEGFAPFAACWPSFFPYYYIIFVLFHKCVYVCVCALLVSDLPVFRFDGDFLCAVGSCCCRPSSLPLVTSSWCPSVHLARAHTHTHHTSPVCNDAGDLLLLLLSQAQWTLHENIEPNPNDVRGARKANLNPGATGGDGFFCRAEWLTHKKIETKCGWEMDFSSWYVLNSCVRYRCCCWRVCVCVFFSLFFRLRYITIRISFYLRTITGWHKHVERRSRGYREKISPVFFRVIRLFVPHQHKYTMPIRRKQQQQHKWTH